jgi:hypothetical protein
MHTARTGSSCASAGLPFGNASASPLGFEKACHQRSVGAFSPSSSKSILPRPKPQYRSEVAMRREPGLCRTKLDQPVIYMRPLWNRRRCHPYRIAQLDAGGSQHVPHPFNETEATTPPTTARLRMISDIPWPFIEVVEDRPHGATRRCAPSTYHASRRCPRARAMVQPDLGFTCRTRYR